ncbi:MAG: Omp28-related outer membrane protein [Candidatus Cryptobacteroides sp.]
MKRTLKKCLGATMCAMLVFSCEPASIEGPEDVSGGVVTASLTEISAPEEGSVETLVVEAPGGLDISTKVESTAKTWVRVNPVEGNIFEIIVARNEATKERKAKVFFSAKSCASATVVVNQAAAAEEKHFSISTTELSATHYGGNFNFNVDAYPLPSFEVAEDADWIRGLSFSDGVCSFEVAEWIGQEPGQVRIGAIKVTPVNGEAVTVSVSQSSSEFVRRSLVNKFTGTWCGYCPFMSFAIEAAMEKNDKIVPLYVYDDLDGDSSLMSLFKVSGLPSGLVDFRAFFSNMTVVSETQADLEALVAESASNYPSVTGFEVGVQASSGKLTIDVSVLPIATEPDMKLAVVVVENGIIAKQEFYGNAADYPEIDFKNYVHDHVVRTSPTGCAGESFPVDAGKVSSKTYTVNIPEGWNPNNLEVAVYTLRPFPAEPVKTVSRVKYTDKAGAYVDNVVSVKAGESVTYDFE